MENRHSRGTGAKLANDNLRPRKDHGGGGGGGTRAAVVPTQDKKGQTMETEGGRESSGSLVVASVAGIARYTALSQISYQSRFCLVSSSASFPFFREEKFENLNNRVDRVFRELLELNSELRSHGKHGILRSRRQ